MAKAIDYKLWPALEGLGTLKFKPAETLEDMYDNLLAKTMKSNGYLENPDAEAFIALQAWAFGKLTKRQAFKKLEQLDYLEWEVV